ncbi:MAG: V-type ATP synthase subunit F [Oscillospiraceae bacterium]|jgi:V/A-type H+-transporting ATPase subunit F|nr:V-type ATP synthase subunit F [Oscillospiraceae bacterium]
MYKIAVMGGTDTVLGFKALGLDTHPVADDDEARRVFRKLTAPEERYAIIYMEERLSRVLAEEIAEFHDKATPAVILIPGRDGSMGLGLTALHDAVIRAVGADIL